MLLFCFITHNCVVGKSYTEEDAIHEIVARASEDMFAKSEAVQEILDSLTDEEKQTFVGKVKEILAQFKQWINDFLGLYKSDSEEAEALRKAANNIDELIKMWDDMLKKSLTANKALETVKARENKNSADKDGVVQYSFRDSKSSMANDLLLPYDEELTDMIKQRGDYIVDSYEKLNSIVNLAFDIPNKKATAYFGIIPQEVLETIENRMPNMPKEMGGVIFKPGKTYSIAATLDSIRHLKDDKNLSRSEIVDYLDRMPDTIVEFDSVSFDYYRQGEAKSNGLLFKKEFDDGVLQSFEIVSNKKRTLNLHTVYMESGDYKKMKSAETMLMEKPSAHVQDAGQSNFNNSVPNSSKKINDKTVNNDDVQYSDKSFAEQVDDVLAGTFDRTNAVYVGKTPKILQDVGLNGNLPMLTTANHIRNSNKPKNTAKHHHGLSRNQIKSIPDKIANPVIIMDALEESRNSIVVVTDMLDKDNSPIVVSVKTDGKGMYNNVEIKSNFLTSY
ncbi:MAG: hypothetical protein IKV98_00280 [Clostridia bacterium]|nr:hypothetical protein [Clostridia bacterium]